MVMGIVRVRAKVVVRVRFRVQVRVRVRVEIRSDSFRPSSVCVGLSLP